MGSFSKLLNDLYYKGYIFTAGITCLYLTQEEVFPRNVYSIAFGLTGIGLMGLITGYHMPEEGEVENNSRRYTVILNKLFNGLYYDGGIFTAGVICIYLTREQVFPRNAYSIAFGMTGVGLMGLMSSYYIPQEGGGVHSDVSITKRFKSLFNKILCGLFYRGGFLVAGLLYLGALPKKNVPRYIYSVTFGVIGTGLVGTIAGLTTEVEVEIYTPKRYRELVGVLFYKGTTFVAGILCSFLTQKGSFPENSL